MQLHFEPDLGFQRQAIDAVADLFRGQETGRATFTVTRPAAGSALREGWDNPNEFQSRSTR